MLERGVINSILHEIFGGVLIPHGFELVDTRRWVRHSKPEIRDVLIVNAWKGYLFSPGWGFSVDLIPHLSGSSVRWRRSNKAAHSIFGTDPSRIKGYNRRWDLRGVWNEVQFRKAAMNIAADSCKKALEDFDQIKDIYDLFEKFQRLHAAGLLKKDYWDEGEWGVSGILKAFFLHQAGSTEKARALIQEAVKAADLRPEVEVYLIKRLLEWLEATGGKN